MVLIKIIKFKKTKINLALGSILNTLSKEI